MIAAALAVLGVVLLASDDFAPALTNRQPAAADLQAIDIAIDSLLSRYGITARQVRKWQVRTGDGMTARTERRALVPPELATVEMNRDLSRAVSAFNGHVVGTERTKESVVVLHVVVRGTTVQSVSLVTDARASRDIPAK